MRGPLFGFGAVVLMLMLAGGCSPAKKTAPKPFMDEKKIIPEKMEWSRDFFVKKPGKVAYRVNSTNGPFTVAILTDAAWHQIQNKAQKKPFDKFDKDEIFLMANSKEFVLEGELALPEGHFQIMMENRSGVEVEFHVQLTSKTEK